MEGKKFMMIGMFVLVGVLLIVVVSAKHAWWHPWGEDVREAPFEATVTISNVAPEIKLVSGVNEVGDPSGNVIDVVPACGLGGTPTPCPIATMSFVARDPNGVGQLTNARSSWTGPGAREPSGAQVGACVESGSLSPLGTGAGQWNSATDRNYTCTLTFNYYWDPGATWSLTVSVDDQEPLTATCGTGGPNVVCPVAFTYTSSRRVDTVITPDLTTFPKVSWTDLDPNADDERPDGAPDPLTFFNRGNLNTEATVSAENLVAIGDEVDVVCDGTDFIPSQRFSAGGVTGDVDGASGGGTDTIVDECGYDSDVPTATLFGDDGDDACGAGGAVASAKIIGFNVPYGASGSDVDNMYFCIPNKLSDLGLVDTVGYTTATVEGGVLWQVNAQA